MTWFPIVVVCAITGEALLLLAIGLLFRDPPACDRSDPTDQCWPF